MPGAAASAGQQQGDNLVDVEAAAFALPFARLRVRDLRRLQQALHFGTRTQLAGAARDAATFIECVCGSGQTGRIGMATLPRMQQGGVVAEDGDTAGALPIGHCLLERVACFAVQAERRQRADQVAEGIGHH